MRPHSILEIMMENNKYFNFSYNAIYIKRVFIYLTLESWVALMYIFNILSDEYKVVTCSSQYAWINIFKLQAYSFNDFKTIISQDIIKRLFTF